MRRESKSAPQEVKKYGEDECGADRSQFPKGRIDSLTNHLAKKCPALPLQDRQRALLQFHELPLPDNMARAGLTTAGASSQMQGGQKMNLPFAPSKQLSALETLAEVSRQHLDLSGQRLPDKHSQSMQHNNVNHAGLLEEFLIDDRTEGSDMAGLSQAMEMSNPPAMPAMYQFNGPLHHSPTNSPHMGNMPLPNSSSMAQMVPSLVLAASAANELMPLGNGMTMDPDMSLTGTSMPGIPEKYFHNHTPGRGNWPSLQPNPLDPLLQDHGKEEQLNKPASQPRPIAMNPNNQTHFTTDFSMNQKPSKPKVRGRFSDSRRKEVQEVRKRGACIRCRMLKKPCSGENPCNTCQNVESARLWKQPCIRTRIAEEFSLYSAGLHAVLAHHATAAAKGNIRLDQSTGRIEASHFPSTGIFATFVPLKCQQSQSARNVDIDPAIFDPSSSPDLELIDGDDDISGKLDIYIKKIGPSFLGAEVSAFMKTTMQTASSITSSNQDQLLPKVVELWNLTRILTSRTLHWQFFSNPSLAPTMATPVLTQADMGEPGRIPLTMVEHPSSHSLIEMQVMGATEKRAACLARVVMNDLERRLLQRQQANPFETFLVAVILLSCVEAMCWLFRTWEVSQLPADTQVDQNPPQTTDDDTLAAALQADPALPMTSPETLFPPPRHPKWPLDKSPASYSQQGERFSDILNMLLKMRGVPPKPSPRNSDGILLVWADDADENAKKWYEGIGVTMGLLEEKANAKFGGVDGAEWELKYVGKIIKGDG